MDRETVIQNIMNNYGKYGITQDMVELLRKEPEVG